MIGESYLEFIKSDLMSQYEKDVLSSFTQMVPYPNAPIYTLTKEAPFLGAMVGEIALKTGFFDPEFVQRILYYIFSDDIDFAFKKFQEYFSESFILSFVGDLRNQGLTSDNNPRVSNQYYGWHSQSAGKVSFYNIPESSSFYHPDVYYSPDGLKPGYPQSNYFLYGDHRPHVRYRYFFMQFFILLAHGFPASSALSYALDATRVLGEPGWDRRQELTPDGIRFFNRKPKEEFSKEENSFIEAVLAYLTDLVASFIKEKMPTLYQKNKEDIDIALEENKPEIIRKTLVLEKSAPNFTSLGVILGVIGVALILFKGKKGE